MSVSRMSLPAASVSGVASAASSSARSMASEPRAVATWATSAGDSSDPPRAGAGVGPRTVVPARAAVGATVAAIATAVIAARGRRQRRAPGRPGEARDPGRGRRPR